MSSAEPPAGRRPDDGSDAAQGDERPMSREDLFGPRGPFGVGQQPAPPPGASGFEPPEDATRPLSPPERDQVTRAFRAEREPHPRDGDEFDADDLGDADRTQVYQAPPAAEQTQVYQPPPAADADPTQVYRPPPPGDRAQAYTPGEYQPGQYQPRSMQQDGYVPGGYEPGQYTGYGSQETIGYPGDSDGYDGPSGGGRRTWLVAALVAVLVVAAGAAVAWVLFGGSAADPETASGPGATTAPTATGSQPSETGPEEGESAGPSESESQEPAAGEVLFDPIPAEPWAEDLDFGFLTKVSGSGDDIELSFNRATFYYGDEATEKNGGEPPDNDYLIEDTNKRVRTFALKEGAALSGSSLLGDDAGAAGREITRDELVENAKNAGPEGIPVWLRHEKGQDSAVTALAEQFIP